MPNGRATTRKPLEKHLGFSELYEKLGSGRTEQAFRIALWRLARRGVLMPVKLMGRNAWPLSEVETYLAQRAASRGQVAA